MPTTLVAGATGYLGRHIVAELHRRGHTVRAMLATAAAQPVEGAHGAPSLDGLVNDWAVGNVTDSAFTRDVAAGVDHVVSALGVTRQKADPWNIDNRANQSILASALRHGATSFTYINALGAETCPAELTRAKTAFARALDSADIRSTVINPSAYFSDAAELLTMAKRGLVPLFKPDIRLNPFMVPTSRLTPWTSWNKETPDPSTLADRIFLPGRNWPPQHFRRWVRNHVL